MNPIKLVKELCDDFLLGKINLDELQSKLKLLVFEGEHSKELYKIIEVVDNDIENILFCSSEINYYSEGVIVVNYLKNKISQLGYTYVKAK